MVQAAHAQLRREWEDLEARWDRVGEGARRGLPETIRDIADLTKPGLSNGRSNVMFELGMAIGLGKPIILLFGEDAQVSIPSVLAGFPCLFVTAQVPPGVPR